MVFIIQNAQNRDSRAVQLKLDDILCALGEADDALISVEDQPEPAIRALQREVRSRVAR